MIYHNPTDENRENETGGCKQGVVCTRNSGFLQLLHRGDCPAVEIYRQIKLSEEEKNEQVMDSSDV